MFSTVDESNTTTNSGAVSYLMYGKIIGIQTIKSNNLSDFPTKCKQAVPMLGQIRDEMKIKDRNTGCSTVETNQLLSQGSQGSR